MQLDFRVVQKKMKYENWLENRSSQLKKYCFKIVVTFHQLFRANSTFKQHEVTTQSAGQGSQIYILQKKNYYLLK